jgi:DNA-binding response OmpR family regulator
MNTITPEDFKILLVEDDPGLSMVLQDYLELMQYNIKLGTDGEEGLTLFKNNEFDLCILDVMLPKLDGFALATAIRQINKNTPIIFLTAKSLKEDRLKGFLHGCDDYITKPFSTDELNLRIKAILRRCVVRYGQVIAADQKIFNIGKFIFDVPNLEISFQNSKYTLTKKEAGLLKLLCENENKLTSREVAQQTIWGESGYFVSRSMDVFIARLRKYLKDDPDITIKNVHGSGFILQVKR